MTELDSEKIAIAADSRGTVDRGDGYEELERAVKARGAQLVGPLFTTTATLLGETWLLAIEPANRQYYNCRACLAFLDRFGGLVTVDERGGVVPALWVDPAPEYFSAAVAVMRERVLRSRVTGVFVNSARVWGQPETKDTTSGATWRHLAVARVPESIGLAYRSGVFTDDQVAAAKVEDYSMLQRALAEYSPAAVKQALRVLRSEALYRGERLLGVAEFLDGLQTALASAKGERRNNIVWRAIATAPPGYAHVRGSMIGTLLNDVIAGLPFDAISRRFAEKMSPEQYRRPTAAPSAGNVAAAEKLVEQLGVAAALPRRFARLADVEKLWAPRASAAPAAPAAGGVFGHLIAPAKPAVKTLVIPPTVMTWVKFQREVLPDAHELEVLAKDQPSEYCALVTAVDASAPNLMQWDNTVSWYVYVNGSRPERWNLVPNAWVRVSALTLKPCHWGPAPARFERLGAAVIFLLEGARDKDYVKSGAFFPENLRAEFHPIRATLEAYAKSATLAARDEADACGLMFRKGAPAIHVRVNSADAYTLDRWD